MSENKENSQYINLCGAKKLSEAEDWKWKCYGNWNCSKIRKLGNPLFARKEKLFPVRACVKIQWFYSIDLIEQFVKENIELIELILSWVRFECWWQNFQSHKKKLKLSNEQK